MPPDSTVLSEPYAGLQAQALGLAEAAGLTPGLMTLVPGALWKKIPAALWPAPLRAVGLSAAPPGLLFTAGGTAAAVGAAFRRLGATVVQVQNPRMRLDRFDLVVANRHDGLAGPNVIVTRTALHRATRARLAGEAEIWRERLRSLPRPLVSVLVGGSNGRLRLGHAEGRALAGRLAAMVREAGVGLAITPSRRTSPEVSQALRDALEPLGAWVWDMHGPNPYFGMLALADIIVVTTDSISMISEAVSTAAPVLLAELPGRSHRIGLFLDGLRRADRVRPFDGRANIWPVQPIDDTQEAADEVRRRLRL